jgi:uncharacterized protein YbjQ (UPF0145 family)
MAKEPVTIVTTEGVPGHTIREYKGLVWASSARSKSILSDAVAAVKLLVGGEIKVYTQLGNEARLDVLKRLGENARGLGANAVVGVRFGSTQLLPSTLDIFAYGTAVVAEKGRR